MLQKLLLKEQFKKLLQLQDISLEITSVGKTKSKEKEDERKKSKRKKERKDKKSTYQHKKTTKY